MNEPNPSSSETLPREFSVPEGCQLCGGDLAVRLTGRTSRSVCRSCGSFARSWIEQTPAGPRVFQRTIAEA